jgi:hypothetical protein
MHDRRDGGLHNGLPSPILSATFRLNGYDTDMTFPGQGLVETGFGFHYLNNGHIYATPTTDVQLSFYMFGTGLSVSSLTTPFETALTGGYGVAGVFERVIATNTPLRSANMQLAPDHLVVSVVTADVPEPGAWALMIVGFGATGAALRRRLVSRQAATPPLSPAVR